MTPRPRALVMGATSPRTSPTAALVAERLQNLGSEVHRAGDDLDRGLDELAASGGRLDVAVVPIPLPLLDSDPRASAAHTLRLVDVLKSLRRTLGRYPRRVIVVCEAPRAGAAHRVSLALAATLCRYATAHTVLDDVRLNVVDVAPPASEEQSNRAADVALALASGWLDAMRGQVLRVSARGAE